MVEFCFMPVLIGMHAGVIALESQVAKTEKECIAIGEHIASQMDTGIVSIRPAFPYFDIPETEIEVEIVLFQRVRCVDVCKKEDMKSKAPKVDTKGAPD